MSIKDLFNIGVPLNINRSSQVTVSSSLSNLDVELQSGTSILNIAYRDTDKEITFAHATTVNNTAEFTTVGAADGDYAEDGGGTTTQNDATRLIIDSISRDKYGHVTEVLTRGLTYGMTSNNRQASTAQYTGENFDLHVPRESDFKALKADHESFKSLKLKKRTLLQIQPSVRSG